MKLTNRMASVGSVLALAVILSSCAGQADVPAAAGASSAISGSATESTPASGGHNDADVQFTQNMVVHHEGAIAMADLAASTTTAAEIKSLAQRISAAQGPEITKMNSWLTEWDAPSAGQADMSGMDMGGMKMDGLSQDEAMTELGAKTGADFDRRFLQLMTEHHRGAIDMAKTELSSGSNPQARELAQTIIDAQQMEIAEMAQLLQTS